MTFCKQQKRASTDTRKGIDRGSLLFLRFTFSDKWFRAAMLGITHAALICEKVIVQFIILGWAAIHHRILYLPFACQ